MKAKKIISFLLMLTILFTMNITPGLADDTVLPESTTLTLNFNSDGGSVVTAGTFFKDKLICEEHEHDHDDEDHECDLSVLTCDKLHTHDTDCYAVCTLNEHLEHDASCYEKQLTCGKEEHDCKFFKCTRITCGKESHDHIGCAIGLVCGKEEHGTLGLHKDSCYGELICTNKSIFHVHTKIGGCYKLICGKELHTHTYIFGACLGYTCGKTLHIHDPISCHTYGNCGKEHKHTTACYSDIQLCSGLHEHSITCQPLTCETEVHTDADHSIANGCYSCSLEEHTHNDEDECFDWPEAPVTATPNPGYYISSVIIDEVSQDITDINIYSTSLYMNVDHEVEVVFALKPVISPVVYEPIVNYTLNVAVEGPGSVTPTSGSYTYGKLVTLTPTADEGARFVGWFGTNGSDVNSSNEISMTSNKSLIARFELIPVDVDEEITDDATPESGDTTDKDTDEVVLDQEVPYGGPSLPQTGGIPMELVVGAGFALITAGFSLKKKEEKK